MSRLKYLIFAATLAGCASGTGAPPSVRSSNPDYITSIEVEATPASTAYELVSRLRPRWLQSSNAASIGGGTVKGQVIVVVLDGQRLGGIESLRTIGISGIKTLQYYDATRAATILRDPGADPVAGAIVISTTKIQ